MFSANGFGYVPNDSGVMLNTRCGYVGPAGPRFQMLKQVWFVICVVVCNDRWESLGFQKTAWPRFQLLKGPGFSCWNRFGLLFALSFASFAWKVWVSENEWLYLFRVKSSGSPGAMQRGSPVTPSFCQWQLLQDFKMLNSFSSEKPLNSLSRLSCLQDESTQKSQKARPNIGEISKM